VVSPARIDALTALASGEHPGVPLDSLLSVSLDDDSAMLEHDVALRLQRRGLLIALRSAERFKNKSEEEVAQMRDQVLAIELERKVLALPIEVRSRLVELDAADAEPVPAAKRPAPVEPKAGATKPERAAHAAPTPVEAAPAEAEAPPPAPGATNAGSSLPGWVNFLLWLFGTWLAARLVKLALRWLGQRIPERREQLEQLAGSSRFLVFVLGATAALTLSFPLSDEVRTVFLGALALVLALACKDFAASVLAGLLLVLQRPFKAGDTVEFGGVRGKVLEIGLSSVRVLTSQKRVVTIPNNEFLTKFVTATQPSAAATPLQIDFFIDPNQDIPAAKKIVEDAIQNTRCIDAPKTRVILVNQVPLDRTVAVRLRTRVFVMGSQPEQEIESELTERVLESFRTTGIRTPAAQLAAAQ
jgi:small-conductance mechanosensitive channel